MRLCIPSARNTSRLSPFDGDVDRKVVLITVELMLSASSPSKLEIPQNQKLWRFLIAFNIVANETPYWRRTLLKIFVVADFRPGEELTY